MEISKLANPELGLPNSTFLRSPLMTDSYQLTMCYAYWKGGIHLKKASFELFFRKCPFQGEYTIFAGLSNVLKFLNGFRFQESDVEFLKTIIPHAEPEFFDFVRSIDASLLTVTAMKEGTMCFPSEPLLRVEGPLAVAQLVETTLLNIVGYPTLVATNASRIRLAAGKDKSLLEFGLRRAQGPDGGMSASLYAVMGGFDKTSNVLAGQLYGLPLSGTHAHSFVMSFKGLDDVKNAFLKRNATASSTSSSEELVDLKKLVLEKKAQLKIDGTQEGELAAFISYASSFPDAFCALVDTYNTLKSGVLNFICVAIALVECGYPAGSVRLDSGDLAYLSKEAKKLFARYAEISGCAPLKSAKVVASNDINETTLNALNEQKHEIDIFGIGTNLVTCQSQPSLGCVYKLVSLEDFPRIKLSDEVAKTTIPGRKIGYRLFGADEKPLLDLLTQVTGDDGAHKVPKAGERVLCRHPFEESKRCFVVPSHVECLHELVWDHGKCPLKSLPSVEEIRAFVMRQLDNTRCDYLRQHCPTKYKVSLDDEFYTMMHQLLLECTPIPVLDI
ncbi:Nicotinate phosphoribosyltransferase [Monocercomonoides exilis]|uniref:Nicotinate phosphoribosyltransferase n=1 Tax=Monocercomonoides exilis TaxID=2049356 RepID=UPI003559EB36|nr:Nicotinate phosphoribosyltransferase [Monocercomonoides exilis]|eukprot:MONOS_4109.1-p1 / transcript=MONOS_4109.1 / gene=MONOS_4109 / organism=Monocercomonoides_exilis_PA203 / gene_product=Nicotinate phosphoribosyltransferase / transcript_product=Nicotinate phosphoribosyltransferase / location=Mono_scaffold00105:1805-3701(-) / protein_length=558 / sequence_SO=supercontig / SO=protein_coding / is_pseudo=false